MSNPNRLCDTKSDAVIEQQPNQSTRPDLITDEMLEYLDDLRESGVTNMFGARPFVQREFPHLSIWEAGEVLSYWMETFGGAR